MISGSLIGQNNADLSSMIDSLKIEDQLIRNEITRARNMVDVDTATLSNLYAKMRIVDSLNQIVLKDLFQKNGYLGIDIVGVESSHNFWLLIQHCDTDPYFQLEVLRAMKVEAEKGNANWRDYAYLLDRVLVNQGKAQMYGTQMKLNADSTSFEPELLMEPERVNIRRFDIGLGKIEWYIETMNERYFGVLNKNN